jgi:hypothetical protein
VPYRVLYDILGSFVSKRKGGSDIGSPESIY